jgi:hypothetical protein
MDSSMRYLGVAALGISENFDNIVQIRLVAQASFECSDFLTDVFKILGLLKEIIR